MRRCAIDFAKWMNKVCLIAQEEYGFDSTDDFCEDARIKIWLDYYNEGYSPEDALAKDMSDFINAEE